MNTTKIYNLAIKLGVKADFRPRKEIESDVRSYQEKYEKASQEEKELFDTESFTNPYSDTRILHLVHDRPIKKVLAGIDIDPEELLLAVHLGGIDLVIAHHPEGRALADLHNVMHLQADILSQYGVPIHLAEGLLQERISEVSRGTFPINHNRSVDAARLLQLNFLCVHTPADNLAARFLDRLIKKEKPKYVGDLLKLLRNIPEYKEAIKFGAGPRLFSGKEERRVGRVALTEITGGTEGALQIYEKLSHAGISTIIGMHVSEDHRKEAEKHHLNMVVAGHMSSDSIGMNLFLDELEGHGIEIVTCSGLIRVSRTKKKKER